MKIDLDNCKMVELTREQARDLEIETNDSDETIAEEIGMAIDDAQGEADAVGKVAYVVLKINGAPL